MRKVTVLASRIEEDCRQNIQTLIHDGQKVAKDWGVDWEAPTWDVFEVFAHTRRSHRSERKSLNLWFTERPIARRQPGQPFEKTFGDIVRSLVVLRHQTGNQCFEDQQQVIIAAQYISQQIAERAHDLTKLTNGDLERACDAIGATQADTTAYKLQRFVEEIGAIIDHNRLCPRRLDFRYSKKKRPTKTSGLGFARLDDPDLAQGASAKLISVDVLKALGQLYQEIPSSESSDRLLMDVVVIALCTGRRIGEILTLPKQEMKHDRDGHAYLLYYKEKRSQGSQVIVLERLYPIPQTIPLLTAALQEATSLTEDFRVAAKVIAQSGQPYLVGLPDDEFIRGSTLGQFLGLSKDSTNQWLKTRHINASHSTGRAKIYRRSDIVAAMQAELFVGPAVRVSPPAPDLELEDLLFLGFRNSFHFRKAPLRYAVYPVNVRHFGDFLGARSSGVFKRYLTGDAAESFRINSHRFRHTLNTILDKGGMSDALQTEWFGRKNPSDTKAYQHMTPAERAQRSHVATASRFESEPVPPKLSTQQVAAVAAEKMAVLDVGPGYCQHDWRNRPCPRFSEIPLSPDSIIWASAEGSDRQQEVIRLRRFVALMLENAQIQVAQGKQEAVAWLDVFGNKLTEIDLAIALFKP